MKNLIFLFALLFSTTLFAQSITSVNASPTVSLSYPRLITSFKLDTYAYAIIISVDADWGFLKQKGDAFAGTTFLGVSSGSKVFNVSGLAAGPHKVYVDVYTNPRTIADRREVTFFITD